jgi:hypothetical protein
MNEQISMQQLKEQRATPAEKFVLNTIKGAKAGEPDEYGNITWRDKDGNWLFKQCFKHGYLWVSYDYILEDLKYHYGLNHIGIRQLINNVMCKHTNNGQLTLNLVSIMKN